MGDLVERVDNIIVGALKQQLDAEYDRYRGEPPAVPDSPDSSVVTRDIINAIADELAGPNTPWDGMRSAEFLRSQANGGARPEPDSDFCSKCREHTGFEWDEEGEEWLSVCCGSPPVDPGGGE